LIKILIAEDISALLKRYRLILEQDEECEVVAAVQTGREAVSMAGIHRPDVVLLDMEMESRRSGLEAAERILSYLPDTKVVVFTVYEDDETVFAAFELGVCDYILKNSTPKEMIRCVKDAYYNRSPIRPVIAQKIRREFRRVKKSESSFLFCLQIILHLTPTELDILNLLYAGNSRKQICEIRCTEMSTVKTQIHHILKKFDQPSTEDLIAILGELHIFEYLHRLKP
jgi:DNA-binding NarL/FixJ family response regulator